MSQLGGQGNSALAAKTFLVLLCLSAETFLGLIPLFWTKEGLMSFYNFRLTQRSFLQHDGLPFANLLSEETIQHVSNEPGLPPTEGDANDDVIYTTPVTLWAFLSQVLHRAEQRCCAAAVARVIVLCVALGREPCADNTGAYCRARARLPLVWVQRLTYHIADTAEAQVPEAWLWKGKHVYLIDGTTVSTPDTAALQAQYPQSSAQKPGLGFPLIRMVVLISLASAMVHGMAMGP